MMLNASSLRLSCAFVAGLILCSEGLAQSEPLRYAGRQEAEEDSKQKKYGVETRTIFVNSGRFGMQGSTSLDTWVAEDYTTDIKPRISNFIQNTLGWTLSKASNYQGLIVIDIEHAASLANISDNTLNSDTTCDDADWDDPVTCDTGSGPTFNDAPTGDELYKVGNSKFQDLADAYELRIDAIEEYFPNAEIGMWGIGTPLKVGFDGTGTDTGTSATKRANIDFVHELYDAGAFAGIDYACPQIYPAFREGETVGGYSDSTFPATVAGRSKRLVNVAVQDADRAIGSDPNIGILVVYTFEYVKPSDYATWGDNVPTRALQLFEGDANLDSTLLPTLEQLRNESNGDGIIFWTQPLYSTQYSSIKDLNGDPTEVSPPYLLREYFDIAFKNGDFNGDHAFSQADDDIYNTLHTASDLEADMDYDDDVDADDLDDFENIIDPWLIP